MARVLKQRDIHKNRCLVMAGVGILMLQQFAKMVILSLNRWLNILNMEDQSSAITICWSVSWVDPQADPPYVGLNGGEYLTTTFLVYELVESLVGILLSSDGILILFIAQNRLLQSKAEICLVSQFQRFAKKATKSNTSEQYVGQSMHFDRDGTHVGRS